MKLVNNPMVSIGLPVYNRETLIAETLDCLLAQTFTDFEIIISDNHSTDGTETICRQYAERDSRIRYIRQEKNLGIFGNFRFVKDAAQGKYFMWTASDDLCEPEFIGSMVECLEANPELALVMTDVKTIANTGQVVHVDRMEAIRLPEVVGHAEANRLLFFNYGDPNHLYHCIFGLCRTDVAKQCWFPTKTWKNMVADLEVAYLAQVAVRGSIATLPAPLKTYRSHTGSTYVKEMTGRRLFDKVMRGLEIRFSLLGTALTNDLPWNVRLKLFVRVFLSSMWSARNFLRGRSVTALPSL